MDQLEQPHVRLTGGTLLALLKAAFRTRSKKRDSYEDKSDCLTDVRILRSGIRVEYCAIDTVPQQVINDLLTELDLWGNSRFNELNQTHWALKNVDLLGVLGAASAPMQGIANALWGGRS